MSNTLVVSKDFDIPLQVQSAPELSRQDSPHSCQASVYITLPRNRRVSITAYDCDVAIGEYDGDLSLSMAGLGRFNAGYLTGTLNLNLAGDASAVIHEFMGHHLALTSHTRGTVRFGFLQGELELNTLKRAFIIAETVHLTKANICALDEGDILFLRGTIDELRCIKGLHGSFTFPGLTHHVFAEVLGMGQIRLGLIKKSRVLKTREFGRIFVENVLQSTTPESIDAHVQPTDLPG